MRGAVLRFIRTGGHRRAATVFWSSDEGPVGRELELAADGGVVGVGVGPLGVGGELDPHAAFGGLLDEGVAVDAEAGGRGVGD